MKRYTVYINDIEYCSYTCDISQRMDGIISKLSRLGHKITVRESVAA